MTGRDRAVSRRDVERGPRPRQTHRDEVPRRAAAARREPIQRFEAVLQRAERVRQASLDAHRLRSTVDSFGAALWLWLSETMPDSAAALPESVDPASLRAGRLRATEIAADDLVAICRGGKLEPLTFVALVAQDFELDVRERIEQRSFQSREQLTRTVREYAASMQHLQSILSPPAATSAEPAPVVLGTPARVDDARVFARLMSEYEVALRRWARKHLPKSVRTEELVQETLVRAARHLEAGDDRKGVMMAYLRTILLNRVRDEMRRSRRRSAADAEDEIFDLDPNPSATVSAEVLEDLQELAALDAWMRRARARMGPDTDDGESHEKR